MRVKRFVLSSIACVFALSMFGSFRWAPAEASHLGQTVPTFTPTPGPVSPTPEPPPSKPPADPTQPPVTVAPTAAPAASSATKTPVVLPVAGSDAGNGPVFLIAAGSSLAVTAWALRLRAGSRVR